MHTVVNILTEGLAICYSAMDQQQYKHHQWNVISHHELHDSVNYEAVHDIKYKV